MKDSGNNFKNKLRPKKFLGQHFLKDKNIARKIVRALQGHGNYEMVVELGPGMGILTEVLMTSSLKPVYLIEVDRDAIPYLHEAFPDLGDHILQMDFLKADLARQFTGKFALIGNFPYNISSQILFKVLDHYDFIPEVVGMVQKEVAERITAPHGNKTYGILSVLLRAYYDIEYLFTVEPHVFSPPPKVRSAVIRMTRNFDTSINYNEQLFKKVVKQGFQNRRKTLRNALKPLNLPEEAKGLSWMDQRAEQLSLTDFIQLTKKLEELW